MANYLLQPDGSRACCDCPARAGPCDVCGGGGDCPPLHPSTLDFTASCVWRCGDIDRAQDFGGTGLSVNNCSVDPVTHWHSACPFTGDNPCVIGGSQFAPSAPGFDISLLHYTGGVGLPTFEDGWWLYLNLAGICCHVQLNSADYPQVVCDAFNQCQYFLGNDNSIWNSDFTISLTLTNNGPDSPCQSFTPINVTLTFHP